MYNCNIIYNTVFTSSIGLSDSPLTNGVLISLLSIRIDMAQRWSISRCSCSMFSADWLLKVSESSIHNPVSVSVWSSFLKKRTIQNYSTILK